jgi:hypothetical protein
MNTKDIEALTGISHAELSRCAGFTVVAFLGDATEVLGTRATIEDALRLLRVHVLPDDAADDFLDGDATTMSDPELQAIATALSEANLMERTSDPTELAYLSDVIEERPELRLVVAWEAVPPNQDAAFGLFTKA